MNQSTLKTFAQEARRELRKQVGLRLDYVLNTDTAELRQRAAQVTALRQALAQEGRETLIERVAYTWFNRLAALRFMDANGYHLFSARVITAAGAQETLPELLQHARAGALDAELRAQLDTPETFDGVLSGAIPTSSREGTAYRMLIIATCHYYHRLMPFLFEKLGDATELLLPEDLLTEHSILHGFRSDLADEDCREVEVIGWLYQFYISERKDEVMARKSAVPTEDIPAVTQLFTPHWIVHYLVENSLGRLWLLNRPSSRLREKMPYYIESATDSSSEASAKEDFLKISKPEEIRLVDPAAGSGHMLTYAFDLLYAIYEEDGYDAPEIPSLILRHNLNGLEICERAAALAAFALCMKARSRDNRFFRRLAAATDVPRPQVIELRDVRFEDGELSAYFMALGVQPSALHSDFNRLLHQFEEAKNFGSLIQPCLTEPEIHSARSQIENRQSRIENAEGQLFLRETHHKVLRVLEQAEALIQRYHVAVANPPYFGPKQMNDALREFAKDEFPDSKADLYAMFMERSFNLVLPRGNVAMVVMQSWMFLHSFEKLRCKLLREKTILSMAHLGPRAFATISGEIVTVTAWCCSNARMTDYRATFCRLIDGNESEKEANFLAGRGRFQNVVQDSFSEIPGSPIAYWIGDRLRAAFRGSSLADITISDGQNKTADNGRFVREHWEVSVESVGRGKKWLPYAKGGPFRRWVGNIESVVDWSEKARQHYRKSASCRIVPEYLWYKIGITWSRVGTGLQGFRLLPQDSTFDMVGSSVFLKSDADLGLLLGLLNTPVAQNVLELLNPSIDLQVKDVRNVPVPSNIARQQVDEIVSELLMVSENDWDSSETSLHFRDQPLLRSGLRGKTLETSWRNWEVQRAAAIRRMQELETENNRLFIAAYGLEGELQPEVPEEQITLARADCRKDMAAFISYAVGCMMGRYSLDAPGLILADAGDTVDRFCEKVGKPIDQLTFAPDKDGILPVLEGEWFADDIVARIQEFLNVTFGSETRAENLRFIETSLDKSLRKYFAGQFYKDHLQTYKKRPIYWMVSSPNASFQALIYLHRYTRDTINILLNDYVREFIGKLDAHQKQLIATSSSESAKSSDRTKAAKENAKIDKMLKELRTWERDVVLPLAQQRIELDLDDGVKLNYLKFPGLLVPIPGLEKKEED